MQPIRDATRHGRSKRGAVEGSWLYTVVISLALLLEGMSSSSINVQVAALRDDLGLGAVRLGLVAAAFLIAYAGLLPVAGQLVDARDGKKVFLLGVTLFGAGCVLCAAAADGWMLVGGRFVQGGGAALSAPAALALITRGLPPGARRNRVVALFGAMGAAGFSLGLVLPGFLVAAVGWRASFLVLLPVALVVLAVVATARTGAEDRSPQRIDVSGAALLTAVLMIGIHLVTGVGGLPGWLLPVEGVCVLALAVVLARRGGVGGFPAAVVYTPRVLGPCIALAAVFSGVLASCYIMSLSLQAGDGFEAFRVGLALLPSPIAFALFAGFGSRLVTRCGTGAVLGAGMVLIGGALATLAVVGDAVPSTVGVPVAQAAIGTGLALSFPAASIRAVDAAPEAFRGRTAGLLTTWQNVGGALGLALVTAGGVVPTVGSPAAAPGLGVSAALVLVGALLSAVVDRRGRTRSPAAVPARYRSKWRSGRAQRDRVGA